MVVRLKIRSKSNIGVLLMILIFFSLSFIYMKSTFAADDLNLGLKVPSESQYGTLLFPKQPARGLSLLDFGQPQIKKIPRSIKRDIKIDSTAK